MMRSIENWVIWGLVILALLLVVVLFPPTDANAQQMAACGPKDQMLAGLRKKFGEEVAGTGINQRGDAIIILSAPGWASYSVIMASPSGLACIVDSGKGLEIMPVREVPTS